MTAGESGSNAERSARRTLGAIAVTGKDPHVGFGVIDFHTINGNLASDIPEPQTLTRPPGLEDPDLHGKGLGRARRAARLRVVRWCADAALLVNGDIVTLQVDEQPLDLWIAADPFLFVEAGVEADANPLVGPIKVLGRGSVVSRTRYDPVRVASG